ALPRLNAFDGDGFEDYVFVGTVHAVAGEFADFLHHVVAFGDFAEDGVLAGEPAGVRNGDEELGAVGVGAGVGHGELAGLGEAVRRALGLVGELVAGAAHAGAFGVSALDHELRDDAVEDGAVIELGALLGAAVPVLGALGEADEVGDSIGRFLVEQLADDGAFAGFKYRVRSRCL